MSKEHFERVLNKLTDHGVLQRGKTADLVENYDFAVKLIEDEDAVLGPPPSESPNLGSFGVLSGTLSVDRSNEERDTLEDVEALADEHVTDDEPTTVGTRKGRKKSS